MEDGRNFWWKSIFSEDNISDVPTKFPSLEIASKIWPKISPILDAKLDINVDFDSYWQNAKELISFISSFKLSDDCQFSDLIDVIYKNSNFFYPKAIQDCIPFIEKFCPQHPSDFFVYEFFRCIGDSILCVQTCIYLHKQKHPLWVSFIKRKGSSERFIDLFLPFFTVPAPGQYDNEFWALRLEIFELITNLLVDNQNMICLMNETLLSIHKITKSVIFNSPSEFSINFLRNAFQIIEIGIQKVKPDISSRRITALVKASPPSRITHALIVRFAYNHSAYIKKDTLAKILISQQVVSTFDLEMLDKIASNPASGCVQEVVQYISKLMILDPLFGRSAAVLLKNILTKNPKKETVDWVCKLTKRFAMFIAMAVQKKKYLGRVSRVTECFVNTLAPNLNWFSNLINDLFSGLVLAHKAPAYFNKIFVLKVELDNQFLNEMESFQKAITSLKSFPFDAKQQKLFEKPQKKEKKPRQNKTSSRKKPKRPKWQS